MDENDMKIMEQLQNNFQQDILEGLEKQKRLGKETDFAAGFAFGVKSVTLHGFGISVEELTDSVPQPVVFVNVLRLLQMAHQVAHKMNGEDMKCSTMDLIFRKLMVHVALGIIFKGFKESEPKEKK